MALDGVSRRVISTIVFLMGFFVAETAALRPVSAMEAEPQNLSATLLDVETQKVPLNQSLRWHLSQAFLKEAAVTLLGPNGPTPVDVAIEAGGQDVRIRP